jgi:lysozyme
VGGAVKGLDVASWAHPDGAPIDWDKVLAAKYVFALVKVSQGTSYVNPWGERDIEDARAAGLLVGAYHYFTAGDEFGTQAAHFVNQIAHQDLDLGAWCDWESYVAAPFSHTNELTGFVDAVKAKLGTCGVYCDQAWAEALKESSVVVPRLWVAAWGGEAFAGSLIWQDAGNVVVPGVSGMVDTDVLLSTRGVDIPTAPAPKHGAPEAVSALHLAKALDEGTQDTPTEDVAPVV